MRYKGMTYESTHKAMYELRERMDVIEARADKIAAGCCVTTTEGKVDQAVKSIVNNLPTRKETTEPDANGVKTMSCGSAKKRPTPPKLAAARAMLDEIHEILKKKI